MKKLIKKILKEEGLEWAEAIINDNPMPFIKIKAATTNPKNCVKLVNEFMFGDGDSYDRNEVLFMFDTKQVQRWRNHNFYEKFPIVYDFFLKMSKGGGYDYDVLLRRGIFSQDMNDEYFNLGLLSTDEGGWTEMPDSYKLFFYDENGTEFHADFDFKK